MKKKQFRIVTFNKGFLTLYYAQVKTWLGWIAFSAFPQGSIYYILDFVGLETRKSNICDYIECYRKIKGLMPEEIEINEISKISK